MSFPCDAIVCVDLGWGISKDSQIPWIVPEEQQFFRDKVKGTLCAMGRKTFDSLGSDMKDYLNQTAVIFVFSRTGQHGGWDSFIKFQSGFPGKPVMVCGGADIYDLFFQQVPVQRIFLTTVLKDHQCDRKFRYQRSLYQCETSGNPKYDMDTGYIMETYVRKSKTDNEKVYLSMLRKILLYGSKRTDRTGTGTISTFGSHMVFDLRMGFPLMTTKKMYWKGIVEELLFFIQGKTNTKELEDKGVNIWKGNTTKEFHSKVGLSHLEEGDMGKMYGYQWRHFNDQVDQLQGVIQEIKQNPSSRRLFVSAWNPCQLDEMVLPPCHVSFQIYVSAESKEMDLHMYQRSADMFLGIPFNIASYALLLHILAKVCGNYVPRRLYISIGDAHIYTNHIEQVKEQLGRVPMPPPMVGIRETMNIDELVFEDIALVSYSSHPAIRADMAI